MKSSSPETDPSRQHQSASRLGVRRRPDLVFVQTFHTNESAFVAKDPISLKYHRLRPDEYFVLCQLDRVEDLEQLKRRYEARFTPQKVTAPQLNRLLFRFHQSGLLISDAKWQGSRLHQRQRQERRKRWMRQAGSLLFIRFPGVDPEPFLRRVHPWVKPLLGRTGVVAATLVILAALVVFLTHWDRFVREFPSMENWIQLHAVVMLALVIGFTKVCHELGHAIACKQFGGECHQIGPMLLVFTPALYCDTSDSWMLPNRFQRAAVGMAGIAVEILLASLATLLWVTTGEGLLHSLAMNVMLVCGVSTVVFNANPLLRYDGYYVLSDLWDQPNLGDKSRRLLISLSSRALFGVESDPAEATMSSLERMGLCMYALLSFFYRWALTLVILWFVSIALRPYGMESVGKLFCVFAIVGMILTLVQPPLRFFQNPAKRKHMKVTRTIVSAVSLCLVLAACFIPFDAHVRGTGRIVPREDVRVYVKTAGELTHVAFRPGDVVKKGDLIAIQDNPNLVLKWTEANNRRNTQQVILDSLVSARASNPEAANQIPAARALLKQLTERASEEKAKLDALQIKAPVSGYVLGAAKRSPIRELVAPMEQTQLVSWTGMPTDSMNAGCYLEPGTELVSIAAGDLWDSEILVDQAQISRIKTGAAVTLLLESAPASPIKGRVVDVAKSQWSGEQHATRRDDPEAAKQLQPVSTSYLVRVELEPASIRMITGSTSVARIDTPPRSVFQRLRDSLHQLFRLR